VAPLGRIRRRLTLAIGLTALIPVLVSIGLVEITVRQTSARFFVPEIGQRLDQSLELYQELARAIKARMRSDASVVAADHELGEALKAHDGERIERRLRALMASYPEAVSFGIEDIDGETVALVDRGRPVDPKREKQLAVRRSMGPNEAAAAREVPQNLEGASAPPALEEGFADDADEVAPPTGEPSAPSPLEEQGQAPPAAPTEPEAPEPASTERSPRDDVPKERARDTSADAAAPDAPAGGEESESGAEEGAFELVAVFATSRLRFDQHAQMGRFVDSYHKIESRRASDEQSYVFAFATLLGLTILAAIGVGVLLARGVSKRIDELAAATGRVGAGDLSVRVNEEGSDELADLARAFNRMLAEVESSRVRIEYLQRIGAWQEMARRLAHEIKNPLTPIQLAVQEVERRYPGGDHAFARLLGTTREIVEDEVGTLRRLVSEFSSFARMPRAELEPGDLAELLRQQATRLELGAGEGELEDAPSALPTHVRFELDVEVAEAPAYMDRQMLGRVLANLIRNAADALAGAAQGRIALRLGRAGDFWLVDVDDDGPGIDPERRPTVFDPYVTTKAEGTGLGLAIVKKIVVEHGGMVVAQESPWGGARLRVRLPVLGTPAAEAALEASHYETPPVSRPQRSLDSVSAEVTEPS
jgi:nitrogen fixation/metabolism regulation signal transduction histidine kinase